MLVDEKFQFLLALCETLNDPDCITVEDIDDAGSRYDAVSEQGFNAETSDVSQGNGAVDIAVAADGDKDEISFEWLREAVEQEETVIEEVTGPVMEAPPSQDKKNLTPAERDQVKPAAEFIMDQGMI